MTTITILPEEADSYRALAGEKESTGRTAGEALDALRAQLGDDESATLVIVQDRKADEFFTAAQQERLAKLMQLREAGTLATEEGQELERLVEAELVGACERAKLIADATAQGEEKLRAFSDSRFDAAQEVEELLAMLPEDVKRIIQMHYIEGFSLNEIAVYLGGESVQVRRRLATSMSKLAHHMRSRSEQNPVSPDDSITAEKTG